MSHEQVPEVVIMRQAKLLFRVYGVVGWFPTVVRIRLSLPPAGAWLAGAWAELGKMKADLPLSEFFIMLLKPS